jgi:glycosyltransferase involved in cell wall biosynthesis
VRVLWVSAEPPDRSGGGGNIRQAHLLSAVAAVHETHLLLAGELTDAAIRRCLASVTELPVAVASPPRSSAARRLLDLRLAGPEGPPERFAGRAARAVLAAWLSDAAALSRYDVVVVQHGALAPVLPRHRSGQWVAELHNVESGTLHAMAGIATARRQRLLLHAQARRAGRLERWIGGVYDRVVTVSADDAAALSCRAHVVPNGVDVSAWPVSVVPAAPTVMFTATLDYLPNVEGIQWFVREVWPRVRAVVPDARLDVVGRRPVESVAALAELPGVAVHANVPDVRPFVTAARVCVVPLRVGSGSRLKVLEAWAGGRPVVGTTVGLAGLAVEDGRNALVADGPGELAVAVGRTLRDASLAQALADAGRQRARERYDWASLGAAYAGWLGSLTEKRQ